MAKNWAIAIGINQYERLPTSAHLRYAARDAELMREFLHQTAGFPSENIFLCSDTSPAMRQLATRPSQSILRRILGEELRRAQGADNLLFFFSGYGMAGRNGDYFLPIDGNPNELEDTAVSVHFVTECLRHCQAKNVVLVLDMCRNEGRTASLDIGVNAGEQTIELARQQNMTTLFSCSRGERSYEIPELQQGAFTYCLVNGLKQHTILRQLEQYLIQETPKLRQRYPYSISLPRIIPESEWKYDASVLLGDATQSDGEHVVEQATTAERHEEFEQTGQLWGRVVDPGKGIESAEVQSSQDRIRSTEIRRLSLPPPFSVQPWTHPGVRDSSQSPASSPASAPLPQPSAEKLSPVQTFFSETARPLRIRKVGGFLGIGGETVCDVERESLMSKGFIEQLGNGITLEMVQIPRGAFSMGSPKAEEGSSDNERPQRTVTVQPFFMGRFSVTQAQYEALMGTNPAADYDSNRFVDPNKPALGVSWADAIAFSQKLSEQTGREYRLPSEAEWEYACRAHTTTPFHFGKTITTDLANYQGTDWEFSGKVYPGNYSNGPKGVYRKQPTKVGSFPSNAFGLFDMHGNVWEWCQDHWHESYHGAPTDEGAWIEGLDSDLKLLRGGSWNDLPRYCRSANRFRNFADSRTNIIGFRVVSSIPSTLRY